MSNENFFTENCVPEVSPSYKNLRDIPEHENYRELINTAWTEYQSYCPDQEFIKKSQAHFQGMTWQMFLTVFLIRNGATLLPANDEGPDIIINSESGPIYIEAVSAEKGTGKDAPVHFEDLPKKDLGNGILMGPVVSEKFPNPKIIFRITNAIQSKRTQYAKWVEDKIVDPSRPFIIAVSAGALENANAPGASYGARSVFGIGPTVMHIPRNPHKRNNPDGITTSIKFMPEHIKLSGNSVNVDSFLTDQMPEVSGIIFTEMHLLRYIDRNGIDFELIHNLKAKNPVGVGCLPIGFDTWAEESESVFTLKSNREQKHKVEE